MRNEEGDSNEGAHSSPGLKPRRRQLTDQRKLVLSAGCAYLSAIRKLLLAAAKSESDAVARFKYPRPIPFALIVLGEIFIALWQTANLAAGWPVIS